MKNRIGAWLLTVIMTASVLLVPEGAAGAAYTGELNRTGASGTKLEYALTGETKNLEVSQTPVGQHGKLKLAKVDGYSAPIIVDQNGKPFQLRGASTHGMHWGEMKPYVNKGAFQSLRDEWGVNMVRLVSYVTQGGYTQGSKDSLDSSIQTGVKAATELGMYAIIDWHIHAENPWNNVSDAEKFFEKYAKMYADHNNVIYEICNEPTNVPWYNNSGKDLYSYSKKIVSVIRKYDADALIVCGTNTWSQDVDEVAKKPLKADGFSNILYTFHFYAGTHFDNLMDKVKKATSDGTPIFVTEFGICDASGNGGYNTANADKWIALCDKYNISYACWSLCNKNESASYLLPGCKKTNGGWTEGDLSTTGIWLVNTYRAHKDVEDGTDTRKAPADLSTPVQNVQVVSGKKKLTVKWTKKENVDGYQIQISTSKKFKKKTSYTVKASGKSKTIKKYLGKNLGKKKKYYVRVRAYVNTRNKKGKLTKKYCKWVTVSKKTK